MNMLKAIVAEFWGLFVDDGSLAAQAFALVLTVAALVKGLGVPPLAGAGLLIVGCLLILAFSLRRKLRG